MRFGEALLFACVSIVGTIRVVHFKQCTDEHDERKCDCREEHIDAEIGYLIGKCRKPVGRRGFAERKRAALPKLKPNPPIAHASAALDFAIASDDEKRHKDDNLKYCEYNGCDQGGFSPKRFELNNLLARQIPHAKIACKKSDRNEIGNPKTRLECHVKGICKEPIIGKKGESDDKDDDADPWLTCLRCST